MVNDDGYYMVNDCYIIIIWLVVFRPTPMKNDGVSSSVGMMTFPTEWTKMFQTTNQ
jgi:hypothetical protein